MASPLLHSIKIRPIDEMDLVSETDNVKKFWGEPRQNFLHSIVCSSPIAVALMVIRVRCAHLDQATIANAAPTRTGNRRDALPDRVEATFPHSRGIILPTVFVLLCRGALRST